jgi:hypothetical protein
MANTMTLISSVTVGSGGQTSIVFSSIPATYTDLLLKVSARTNASGAIYDDIFLTVNGQSAQQWREIYTINGSSATSSTSTAFALVSDATGASATASTFSNSEFYIPNYTSTGIKSISSDTVTENNATAANLNLAANTVTNGAAISSITLAASGNTFQQYSNFYLYGIKNS